jgi:hypothetical protein
MQLIDAIPVTFGSDIRRIELLFGNLVQIPPEHQVDAIVISAFPYDYTPTPSSLIGQLEQSGISVQKLATRPFADLRTNFSCWLSEEIGGKAHSFRRLICFEPFERGSPPETVSDIFQALAPFAYAQPAIRSIGMPVLAASDQGYSISTMLPPLLIACRNWLAAGFPLHSIKLVVRSERALHEALPIFKEHKKSDATPVPISLNRRRPSDVSISTEDSRDATYDIFVGYSREDAGVAQHFAKHIKHTGLKVFIDQSEIEIGSSWQQRIFDALESCSITVALYSPGFVQSKVCKEEFNISWLRGRDAGKSLIFPLLLRDVALPAYMRTLNYIDCRMNDYLKIESAASVLAARLCCSKEPSA